MTSIAIVGAGIAGTHLGLILQRAGVEVTLYGDRDIEAQRGGKIRNLAIHFGPMLRQERDLGFDGWPEAQLIERLTCHVELPGVSFAFSGRMQEPALSIDHRLHVPALLALYIARGGRLETRAVDADDLDTLAKRHDLVVVCAGRQGLTERFERDATRSPFTTPQRILTDGVYYGITPSDPPGTVIYFTPHGEILSSPYYTAAGRASFISIKAIAEGAFEPFSRLRYENDPAGFAARVYELVSNYAPSLAARIDRDKFAALGAEHILQGGVLPVVRHSYARLKNGVYALALGDAHVLNDPATGQGANLAANAARVLGQAIVDARANGREMGEDFCRQVEDETWATTGPATHVTNLIIGPLAPQTANLLFAASLDERVADNVANNFADPPRFWASLSSPEATKRFLDEFSGKPQPASSRSMVPSDTLRPLL